MFVKTKNKDKVFYDAEQAVNITGGRVYEVKPTSLIRELIRIGDLVEAEKPSEATLKKYAAEDKAAELRKAKAGAKAKATNDSVEKQLKEASAKIAGLESELEKANDTIVKINLELDELKKAGDPESQEAKDLKDKKDAATDPKKETTKASNSEKA